MPTKRLLPALVLVLTACSSPPGDLAAERVNEIASDFVHAFYTKFPEEVYEVGYPDAPTDRFGDHSSEALEHWDRQVDIFLAELDKIDVDLLAGRPEAITYAFTRERLQALVDRRVCKMELWNISPTWTGWPFMIASTLAIQPIDSRKERQDALARAGDIARFLRTEIQNLRRGLDEGYLAAQSNADKVAGQVTSLIDTPAAESPLFNPAARSDDDEFVAAYRDIYDSEIVPAMTEYRDFLANEYQGRAEIGVGANPSGAACYDASVKYWASLHIDAADIHRKGLSEMARIQTGMLELARIAFDTDDVPSLIEALRSKPEFTFPTEQAVLDFVNDAVDRSRAAAGEWIGNVPDAEVVVIPSPAYEKDSGGGFYSSGSSDGSRPATIQVGTYNPTAISQAGMESLTFHEGYPGHHLQGAIAQFNEDLHPILRYMFVSGSAEGWGLYSELLADEMGLYSSDVTRFGMMSDQAMRAARLVVDPGIHVLGWTRDDAIQYMLENTTLNPVGAANQIDRYAAVPGQATAYLLGRLDIQRLRQRAEDALGDDFDIREFHDRILADGSVTLPMLGAAIEAWIEEH